jgi:hypothetical protein
VAEHDQGEPVRSEPSAGAKVAAPRSAGFSPIQDLGRAIGNRALARLIQQRRPAQPSRALALRDALRATTPSVQAIQRSLLKDHDVTEGKFKLNLATDSVPGGMSGLKGTIKFKPAATAPDSTQIRLLQVVRTEDLGTGKDLVWGGAEAGRMSTQTTADPTRGIEGGWFVDHSAAAARRRTKLADPATSQYYRDYWPNATQSQDGSKAGNTISEASLWDRPASSARIRFSFETLAKATDTGHVYGSVMWGFTVDDPAKGTLSGERSVGRDVALATTNEAIRVFDEYYRNPGATTAPTK